MSELDQQTSKHLDCLIQDFGEIKSEIARRANLQRVVLVSYLAVLAFGFQKAAGDSLSSMWVMGIWCVSALALQFYHREDFEIARLAGVIRERIAPLLASKLGVGTSEIFHSETNASDPRTERLTSPYDKQFNWTVFGLVPAAFTWCISARALLYSVRSASLAHWRPGR